MSALDELIEIFDAVTIDDYDEEVIGKAKADLTSLRQQLKEAEIHASALKKENAILYSKLKEAELKMGECHATQVCEYWKGCDGICQNHPNYCPATILHQQRIAKEEK